MAKKTPTKHPTRQRVNPSHVLVLTPDESRLYSKKGGSQSVSPSQLQSLKLRGSVVALDLDTLSDTTYANLPGIPREEIERAINLAPQEYIPNAEAPISQAIPTQNDQDESAALIHYASANVLESFTTQLKTSGLQLIGVSSALISAMNINDSAHHVVISSTQNQHVMLILHHHTPIGRLRAASGSNNIQTRLDELFDLLGGASSLLEHMPQHVTYLGDSETGQALQAEIERSHPDIGIHTLTTDDLAKLGFAPPFTLLTSRATKSAKSTPASSRTLTLALSACAAAALLPFAAVSALNSSLQNTINRDTALLQRDQAALGEYDRLQQGIREMATIRQQTQHIKTSRLNWPQHLNALVERLPKDNGAFSVKLISLTASAPGASTPGQSSTAPPSSPGQSSTAPPSSPPNKLASYQLSAAADSRSALVRVLANYESNYTLNVSTITHKGNTWVLNATMTEKAKL